MNRTKLIMSTVLLITIHIVSLWFSQTSFKGVRRGEFIMPWDWRQGVRS